MHYQSISLPKEDLMKTRKRNVLRMCAFLCVVQSYLTAQEDGLDSIHPEHKSIKEYTYHDYELKPIVSKSGRGGDGTHPYPHIPFKHGSTSINWCGPVAVTNLANPAPHSVSAVTGTWTVPSIRSAAHDTYCSLWIGIDGFTSPTVEQIGVDCDWSHGHQINYAWFEMYPDYSYEIVGFPVNIGDSISTSVVYAGNDVFVLSIFNNTHHVYTTIPTSYTTMPGAQRSCAEWIVEAPYENGVLPLSHFNLINFTYCNAIINNILGSISCPAWKNTLLTMVTNTGAVKALPSPLSNNGESFTVVWKHE